MVMKTLIAVAASGAVLTGAALAQDRLSLVEGAACAQNAAHIEALEQYNKNLYDDIGAAQAADRHAGPSENALLYHYEKMVAYRQELIASYEMLCASGTMSYPDFRQVCRPQSSGVTFEDTVFCAPLKAAQ